MINIVSKNLSQKTLYFLADKQVEIDRKITFIEKKDRAKKSWDGKKGSNDGEIAFTEIVGKLKDMNVGKGICNYCENDSSIDIEHIFPKSFYPEKAFQWSNYLLSCKKCNMYHKNDDFAVFDPIGSTNKHDLVRGTPPPNDDALLINPRSENAMDFLGLDIVNTFLFTPIDRDRTFRNYQRGDYTRELLDLNNEELEHSRRNLAHSYTETLERYSKVKATTNFEELKKASRPMDRINESNPFEKEKELILKGLEDYTLGLPHPTVWEEIKRQKDNIPSLKILFNNVPEALSW